MSVYIGGTYDILHVGHLNMFRWAKSHFGGPLTIGLNTDEFNERYKKRRPIIPFEERADILKELRCVDFVIPNYGDEDSKPAILESGAKVIVCGPDWSRERQMAQMQFNDAWLKEHGIEFYIYPYPDWVHGSDIKKRIREQ